MLKTVAKTLQKEFKNKIECYFNPVDELTVEVKAEDLLDVCKFLKTNEKCLFEQLMDVCGVDYLHFGIDEWRTLSATYAGYSRGVLSEPSDRFTRNDMDVTKPCYNGFNFNPDKADASIDEKLESDAKPKKTKSSDNPPLEPNKRFAVVYHLLSITHNQRVRVKVHPLGEPPLIPSVTDIWSAANWFEREAFDLYGIIFSNHPDLRRILTDYGFIGYPFRKDFPLIGEVEVKYDEKEKRVLYEPVTIEPRTLTPKVIRKG